MKIGSTKSRVVIAAPMGLSVLVAAVALTLAPAALNSSTPNGLSAYVVASGRGPVPAGSVARHFAHVINSNDFGPGRLVSAISPQIIATG